jgi:hypothetical protein
VFFALLVVCEALAHLSDDKKTERRFDKMGIVFFAIAVLAEIVAYPYGQRNDRLSADMIGSLSKQAEWAETEASSALVKSSLAETKADAATTAASVAKQKADAVEKQASELDRQLLEARAQLSVVDAKRAELDESLRNMAACNAPRVIQFWSIGNQETTVDPLKPVARIKAIIEFVPDAETRRAASHIARALHEAGWEISKFVPLDGIRDGVEIQPFISAGDAGQPDAYSLVQSEWRSRDAADAVIDFLHSYNWQANFGFPLDEKNKLISDPAIIPQDTLRIRVGLYPPVWYVSPSGAKDFTAATAQFADEMQKHHREIESMRLKRDEELMKRMTESEANLYKAHVEKQREEEKLWERREIGPCQTLAPSLH